MVKNIKDTHKIFVEKKFITLSKIIKPNSKVLDVGCNDGNLRFFLKNVKYYCVDVNKVFIERLKKEKIPAKVIDLNNENIPFKKEKFDYIFLLDILEHVVNPKKLLDQAKKRLQDDGKLIITLPNDYHLLNKFRFIFNYHLTEDPFAPFGHLHYFPIKSGERFLKKNNLQILQKIILPPIKPKMIPQSIKNLFSSLFPQSFARDILYVLKIKN